MVNVKVLLQTNKHTGQKLYAPDLSGHTKEVPENIIGEVLHGPPLSPTPRMVSKIFFRLGSFNPLPFVPILGSSVQQQIKIWWQKYGQMWIHVSARVENMEGKGDFARYEQFLLLPKCFQKQSVVVKTSIYEVNG